MFNLKGFLRFTQRMFFDTQSTNRRLTLKRMGWIAIFYTLYPLFEVGAWAGLGLDELFCSDYHRCQVRQPIFILGNPRSGTTFLHRLMARDRHTFSSMQTWEILFAPSIVARRALKCFAALDRRLGGLLHQVVTWGETNWQKRNYTHKQALRLPEEDENLLLHTWSSLTPWSFGAMLEEARSFIFYDQIVPRAERKRAMIFYRHCLQRHLYTCNGDGRVDERRYLAKNPAFNSRIDSVLEEFPDARFIYVARNPLDAIPSFASATKWVWDLVGDPIEYDSLCAYVLELASFGYRYPLTRLEHLPRDRYRIVRFDDLTKDAGRTVTGLYEHLGLDLSPAYAQVLYQESERARRYHSNHHYSLDELGLSREQIVDEYADVFERFDFDTREP